MSKRTRIWLGPAGPAGHTERPAASGISARGVQGWEPHRWSCHVLTQGHVMEGGGPGLDAASASCGHRGTALALCPRAVRPASVRARRASYRPRTSAAAFAGPRAHWGRRGHFFYNCPPPSGPSHMPAAPAWSTRGTKVSFKLAAAPWERQSQPHLQRKKPRFPLLSDSPQVMRSVCGGAAVRTQNKVPRSTRSPNPSSPAGGVSPSGRGQRSAGAGMWQLSAVPVTAAVSEVADDKSVPFHAAVL